VDVAKSMAKVMGRDDIVPEVSGKYRVGDVRHCFADIRLARRLLGYEPRVQWEDGLAELAQWLEGQQADDSVSKMRDELEKRGLAI
jgi:dTDP-L-rhamnose 4-epimerase